MKEIENVARNPRSGARARIDVRAAEAGSTELVCGFSFGPEGLRVGNHVALGCGRLDGSSGWFPAELSSEPSSLSCNSK